MIEVRCCCDGHLLGHMEGDYLEGRDYTFKLRPSAPWELVSDVRPQDGHYERMFIRPSEALTMRCLVWGDADGCDFRGVVALQSRDYPIEQLRRIPLFRELAAGD